jgi:hypothetical protein
VVCRHGRLRQRGASQYSWANWDVSSGPTYGDPRPATENEANARLIAAAPELYEALDYLARYHKSGGNEGDPDEAASRKAFAALTKARGEAL